MKNKKGQGATDFLLTYGWSLLVVLVAIGALAYFGVLSPPNFLVPQTCERMGYEHVIVIEENNVSTLYCFNESRMERGLIFSDTFVKQSNGTLKKTG